MTNSENSKRIAKNTLVLYVRMLFMMLVGLYTSRVVLDALGEANYGIYNVVGGVVPMLSVLTGALSSAISRFITFELGTGNQERLSRIFSTSVNIQFLMALAAFVLCEVIGVWFLNEKMNIPSDRMEAAHFVLQCSIASFMVSLISVPYNAVIVAHERMSAFAYIGIFEVVLKLAVAYLIYIAPIDSLKLYALLLVLVSVILRITYGIYCRLCFEEAKYHFIIDRSLLKEMFTFSGWNFIGSSSAMLRDQGGNVLINVFFGPSVNAARGIAVQVSAAITVFVGNFMTAINPQITKSYAKGDFKYLMTLIFQSSRLSYYVVLLLSLPIIFETDYILHIWLKEVPDHTVLFVRLVLLFALSESLSSPLMTAMLATGKIRDYQIVVGGLQMLNLPVSYLFLHMGMMPESVVVVAIIFSQLCLFTRLVMLRKMINLRVREYLSQIWLNVILISCISTILPLFLSFFIDETFLSFIYIIMTCLVSTVITILFVGCTAKERIWISEKVKYMYRKMSRGYDRN